MPLRHHFGPSAALLGRRLTATWLEPRLIRTARSRLAPGTELVSRDCHNGPSAAPAPPSTGPEGGRSGPFEGSEVEGLLGRRLTATWLGPRLARTILCLLLLCIAVLATVSASADPVFRVAYRVRVSDRGIFSLGPLEVASPAVTQDGFSVVVGGGSGRLVVLDAASGETSFEVQLDGGISATPLVLADRFVVGTDNGGIYLVGADGRMLWPAPARIKGAVRGRPALWHSSLIIVADDTSSVHAVSMADGSVVASFSAQSYARRGLSPFTVFGYPDPLVDGDLAYVGFETGAIAALKPKGTDGSDAVSSLEPAWQVGPCSAP
ncbi:MAG: hypothetical protein FJ109_21280, partial [Deltaproteobacteria bacterium]|nr:hypothetical protein [Deltaproteobacteria bacterium]